MVERRGESLVVNEDDGRVSDVDDSDVDRADERPESMFETTRGDESSEILGVASWRLAS